MKKNICLAIILIVILFGVSLGCLLYKSNNLTPKIIEFKKIDKVNPGTIYLGSYSSIYADVSENEVVFYDYYEKDIKTGTIKYGNIISKVNVGDKIFFGASQSGPGSIEYEVNGNKRFLEEVVANGCTTVYEVTQNVVYSNVCFVNSLYNYSENSMGYYGFAVQYQDKYTFINLNGEFLTDKLFEDIIVTNLGDFGDVVDYNNLYVRVKFNGKYGVYDLKNDKFVIENIYNDLRVLSDNYVAVKESNGWKLANMRNQKISSSYDGIISVYNSEEYFVVFKNGYINLINKNGNELINEDIKYYFYNEYPCCGESSGVSASKENDIINITIDYEDFSSIKYEYNYNVNSQLLEKVS